MSCDMHSHYLKDWLMHLLGLQFWFSGKACNNLYALNALITMGRLSVLQDNIVSLTS